jgi:hypothetical protein
MTRSPPRRRSGEPRESGTAKLDVTKSTALGGSATNSVRDYIAGIAAAGS